MILPSPVDASPGHPSIRPWRWSIWRLRTPALVYVLAVEVAAVVAGVALSHGDPVHAVDIRTALLLALGCAAHTEAVRGIERRREVLADGRPYVDLKSLWSFAGLLLLPAGLTLSLVVFTFAYWWLRVSQRPVLHRWVFSTAAVVLASCGADLVLDTATAPHLVALVSGPAGFVLVAVAALVRWLINVALVVGAIGLSAPSTTWSQRTGSPTDSMIGLGALALGTAVAVLSATAPWIVPILLVPVVVMHRGVLLPQFARAANTDGKTGLDTAPHWHERATRELTRAQARGTGHPGVGVLMVDLDEFKAVNDRHGHLVGDLVLRSVAEALRTGVRAQDAVGRFGGEEFVVLLAEVTPTEIATAADRLRRRIAACEIPGLDDAAARLTASIGAASYPACGTTLDGLLLAADTALLAAKRAGRDRVELAPGVSGTRTVR